MATCHLYSPGTHQSQADTCMAIPNSSETQREGGQGNTKKRKREGRWKMALLSWGNARNKRVLLLLPPRFFFWINIFISFLGLEDGFVPQKYNILLHSWLTASEVCRGALPFRSSTLITDAWLASRWSLRQGSCTVVPSISPRCFGQVNSKIRLGQRQWQL